MFSYVKFREMLAEKQKQINNLHSEDGGLTIYSGNGELSPGCRACKTGGWLCVFVTERCNMRCHFCPQPRPNHEISLEQPELPDEHFEIGSTFCRDINVFEFTINLRKQFLSGISFSGGEPLLVMDKILSLAEKSNRVFDNNIYLWIYTNGVLVNKEKLKRLQDANIREIRFNWAATHFDDRILNNMVLAANYMERITVEIPMHHKRVLDILPKLKSMEAAGVSQLNCAEFYVSKNNSPKMQLPDTETYIHRTFGDKSPYWSRLLTYDVMQYAEENGVNILINDCSNDAKVVQKYTREVNGLNL